MDVPVVSVVMPVFNAEAFLGLSVGSVLGQTFADFELICFNDASTDGSLAMLRAFGQADGRVRVIDSTTNVKQGGGRNRAVAAARGRFVVFVDADDALEPDALERCVAAAMREDADMVAYDYVRFSPSRGGEEARVCPLGADASELRGDALRRRMVQRPAPVWSAMYERRLITDNGLFFPEGVFYEDNAVAAAIQLSARNPVKIDAALYRYRFDNVSVTRSTDNYRFFDRLASAVALLGHVKRLGLYGRFADELDMLFVDQYLTHTVYGCVYRFSKVPVLRHRYVCRTVSRYVGDFRRNPYYRARPLGMRLKLRAHMAAPRLIKLLSAASRRLRGRR